MLVILEMKSTTPAHMLLCIVELLFQRDHASTSISCLRSKAYLIICMHVCKHSSCTSKQKEVRYSITYSLKYYFNLLRNNVINLLSVLYHSQIVGREFKNKSCYKPSLSMFIGA